MRDEPSDAALAQALEQNPFVTDIVVNVDREQRANWHSLLGVIATRANLEEVRLHDAIPAERRNTSAGLVRAFLRAIQQNNSIRSIELLWLRLPIDISTYVDTASSITMFILCDCDMEPAEREQGTRSLALALQRNTNIEILRLSRLEAIYAVPILEVLGSNVSLKTFVFSPPPSRHVSDASAHALHQLLKSTTSIQIFELRQASFSDERLFHPIAQGIISSECVSDLKLSECSFEDRESFAQLQSILQNKQNLSSLCLQDCEFGGGGQVQRDIISTLLRPDSSLRCFEFYHEDFEEAMPDIQFKTLLRAIEKSKLECFRIGYIGILQQLQTLTESIPSMKLKELEVDFWENEGSNEFDRDTIMQDLLHAVEKNFSLRSVKAKLFGTDLFDNDGKQTLAFFANRNELLDQWVSNPAIVEQRKVWPDALSLAQRAGPNALFRGLRSVLESDYGSLPGGRKRKRPQYYTPT